MAGEIPRPQGGMPSPARGTAVPLSRWSSGVWGTSKVPQRPLVTFRRWKVTNTPFPGPACKCEILSQPGSKWSIPEPTVSTPHFLFDPPKRKRAVDGTKEKGGRGSRKGMVRPPPDPLLSVRLTEACASYKQSVALPTYFITYI